MQSTSTARPEENRGNLEGDPLGVGGGYSGHLGDPAHSVLNASVPGGNLSGAGRGEPRLGSGLTEPPGLEPAGRSDMGRGGGGMRASTAGTLAINGSWSRKWKRSGASPFARSGHEATTASVHGQRGVEGLRSQGQYRAAIDARGDS